jgi:hypothetical protein
MKSSGSESGSALGELRGGGREVESWSIAFDLPLFEDDDEEEKEARRGRLVEREGEEEEEEEEGGRGPTR